MEEVNVVVGNNSAEFSRPAEINMTTKGGTNQFHGKGAYWHQNNALAEVRHQQARKKGKSFRISLGSGEVYTTFAIEFEPFGKGEAELLQE
jgi:hypothetical protein